MFLFLTVIVQVFSQLKKVYICIHTQIHFLLPIRVINYMAFQVALNRCQASHDINKIHSTVSLLLAK
uniref:Uncharacterized protein n=1 Tax=Anguilla anguilla TaxID=7936 RepID=A0A0E9X3A0_ANGAN